MKVFLHSSTIDCSSLSLGAFFGAELGHMEELRILSSRIRDFLSIVSKARDALPPESEGTDLTESSTPESGFLSPRETPRNISSALLDLESNESKKRETLESAPPSSSPIIKCGVSSNA